MSGTLKFERVFTSPAGPNSLLGSIHRFFLGLEWDQESAFLTCLMLLAEGLYWKEQVPNGWGVGR